MKILDTQFSQLYARKILKICLDANLETNQVGARFKALGLYSNLSLFKCDLGSSHPHNHHVHAFRKPYLLWRRKKYNVKLSKPFLKIPWGRQWSGLLHSQMSIHFSDSYLISQKPNLSSVSIKWIGGGSCWDFAMIACSTTHSMIGVEDNFFYPDTMHIALDMHLKCIQTYL